MVRIAGSHPAGPGSIPGTGTPFYLSAPVRDHPSSFSPPHFHPSFERAFSINSNRSNYDSEKRSEPEFEGDVLLLQARVEESCHCQMLNWEKNKGPTRMGFEPTRAEHIGLAVQRLNHSATSSTLKDWHKWKVCVILLTLMNLRDTRMKDD